MTQSGWLLSTLLIATLFAVVMGGRLGKYLYAFGFGR